MRPRISLRACVRPSVGRSVGPSVGPSVCNAFVKNAKKLYQPNSIIAIQCIRPFYAFLSADYNSTRMGVGVVVVVVVMYFFTMG